MTKELFEKLEKLWVDINKQGMAEGYSLKKTKVEKTFSPGDPDEYYTSGGADVTTKDTDYEIINNKTGQVVGTASWTTNDYFGPGALKITMNNGATRWLDIWESEKGNPQTAFNRFVKDPKTAKKYKEQGVAEGSFNKCFDKACKLYDKAVEKDLNPILYQVADYKGDGSNADSRWAKLPQHVWSHYVTVIGDTVYDPTAKQFGQDKSEKYNINQLEKEWGKIYKIRPKQQGVAGGEDGKLLKSSVEEGWPEGIAYGRRARAKAEWEKLMSDPMYDKYDDIRKYYSTRDVSAKHAQDQMNTWNKLMTNPRYAAYREDLEKYKQKMFKREGNFFNPDKVQGELNSKIARQQR